MGGYDLYGNWYPREIDAMNAEMAQCADIDRRHREREPDPNDLYVAVHELECRIRHLEDELDKLKGRATEAEGD